MKRLLPLLLAALLLTMTLPPAGAQSGGQVWAYYLGFWLGPGSWRMQGDVLQDRPARGLYDGRDAAVIDAQMAEAQGAGIDAFIVNWRNTAPETQVLNTALDVAAGRGFKVAASIDAFDGFDGVASGAQYIVGLTNHPAYLRYNGKPVVFFAFQNRTGLTSAQWQGVRAAADPSRQTTWIAEGLSGCCVYGGAMDGMYAFNLVWDNSAGRMSGERAATFNAGGSIYVPTIHPGWDENAVAVKQGRSNPAAPVDRAGGGFLASSFNNAASTGTDVILIVSWNEFAENSHIEPSLNYGTQSLDTLRALTTSWKGRAPAAPSNVNPNVTLPTPIPGPALEATVLLYVRPDASTNGAPLGTITPGTPYAITGQQPGWYTIDYNGQTGYVSAEYVVTTGAANAPAPAPNDPAPAANTAPINNPPAAAPASASGTLEPLNYVYVRPAPNTGGEPLGMIAPGERYTITGEQSGWFAIDYNGQTGYVAAQYVSANGAAPAVAATGVTMTLTFVANVRATPNTSGAVLGIAAGESVWNVTGRTADGAWLRVNFQGQSGWVSAELGRVSTDVAAIPVVE